MNAFIASIVLNRSPVGSLHRISKPANDRSAWLELSATFPNKLGPNPPFIVAVINELVLVGLCLAFFGFVGSIPNDCRCRGIPHQRVNALEHRQGAFGLANVYRSGCQVKSAPRVVWRHVPVARTGYWRWV